MPPVSGVGTAQPEGIAVSPDGRYLVVALNGADSAVVVNLASLALSLAAGLAIFRLKAGVIPVLLACAGTGVVYYFVAGLAGLHG